MVSYQKNGDLKLTKRSYSNLVLILNFELILTKVIQSFIWSSYANCIINLNSIQLKNLSMTKFAQFLVIAALVFMAKGDEEITDFTYSGKYTESSNSHQINIRPNERSAKDFQYPAICSFYTRFEEMQSFKVSESTSTDVQSFENI